MNEKTFSKIRKQGEDFIIRIPREDRHLFKIGDPVWIEKIIPQ